MQKQLMVTKEKKFEVLALEEMMNVVGGESQNFSDSLWCKIKGYIIDLLDSVIAA